jgi:SAM-dependent methyltransferase
LKESLLKFLRAPRGNEPFELRDAVREGEEIITGRLCSPSGAEFPIIRGIPRFVKDQEYTATFGLQWNMFKKTQLDSAHGSLESRETFIMKTGWQPDSLHGCVVLEAGCGMGRFLEIASSTAEAVIGVDMSQAVDAAFSNLSFLPNVHIIQADIFHLPFAEETFDRIYSIGVLHHTPDPRAAFLKLPALLKSNGEISIWVYSRTIRNPCALFASDLYRIITTRLPPSLLIKLAKAAIPLGSFYRTPLVGTIFNTLLPVSPHPNPEWRWLDTFDWYSPRYQHRYSYQDILQWYNDAALDEIRMLESPVGVTGKKGCP